MNPFAHTNWVRFARYLLFIASAAVVALAMHLSAERPWLSVVLVVIALAALVPPYLSRRRFRKLLLSGDAQRVAAEWREAAERGAHHETTGALVAATAFAAYGWVQEARLHLQRIRPGPDWEAIAEHRLFVETLLEAFDGDRDQAMQMAGAIEAMPLPAVGPRLRSQVVLLRNALAALARAFAHHPHVGDLELLLRVARSSPLVSWAMRYAAAIVAVDRGENWRVPALLSGAPAWPQESAFRRFHDELLVQLMRVAEPGPSNDSRCDL